MVYDENMPARLISFILRNRWLFIILFVICVSSLIAYFSGQVFIDKNKLALGSYHVRKTNSSIFSLYSTSGAIFHSNQQHLQAALDFIQQNPRDYLGTKLFTNNLDEHIHLQRSIADTPSSSVSQTLGSEHYFFQQVIDGIPVYGSQIAVHIKKSSDVYAAAGAVITNYQVPLGLSGVTTEQAKIIALQQANEDAPQEVDVTVQQVNLYMLNLEAIGLSNDSTTHKTLAVTVTSRSRPVTFASQYFVDLATGNIVYSQRLSEQVLARMVYNCTDSTTCTVARQEGQAGVSDQDVNTLYTIFSQVYAYFNQHFGRDSLDNQGLPLVGYVHRSNIAGFPCPNAAYLDGEIQLCDGMVVTDIVSHELTHAVTHYTAGLIYAEQSGAINESNSDIFASAIDGNWTIGEDIHLPGVLTPFRYLNDPPKRNQPDRLFSPLYYCGHDDNGGIHVNEGVINKSFYLLTQGGNFNGCQVQGIGKDRSYAIQYRALTRYLTPTANFKDMYIAWLLSCNDLYGDTPAVCLSVEHALQATELDQQSDADQTGPHCENIHPDKPACATSSSETSPIPTLPPTEAPSSSNPQTLLPVGKNSGCQIVSTCNSGVNGIQLCTFKCK